MEIKYNMKKLLIALGLAAILLAGCTFLSGCASVLHKNYVLTETESYYLVPANTSFKARLVKDGPIEEVRRTADSYAVDSGYLVKLQEMANVNTFK